MAIPQSATILHHLRQTVLRHENTGLTDGQLLRSFLFRHDEAAFEALVRRHGPMVRGVCRRVLRNLEDADDAFQAAFLVLIRKAPSLTTREVLGDWLHGVAYRTALKARVAASRRRMKEKQALRPEVCFEQENRSEWLPLLDEEVGRLPAKYRLPVVLCDIEGRTRKEAAQHLGWPEGTVSGRLSRARAMLARRLTRRGVVLSAATLAAGMASEASARLPISVVRSICKAALGCAAGSAAGSVPAHVAALSEGVVKAMFVSKLKNAVALVTVALVLTAGAGAWRYAAVAAPSEEQKQEVPAQASPKADAAQTPKLYPQPVPTAAPQTDVPQAPVAPPIPPAPRATPRSFLIDVSLAEMTDGKDKVLADPRFIALEGTPASFALGSHRSIPLGGGMTERVLIGNTISAVVRSGKENKIYLDITVSVPTRTTISDCAILDTKTRRLITETTLDSRLQFAVAGEDSKMLKVSVSVQEMKPDTGEKKIAEAEKNLKMAEFWRRTGHPGSALCYYEELSQDYPGTIYAERAKERMIEMEKQLLNRKDLCEADRFIKERLIESKTQGDKPGKQSAKSDAKPPARIWRIFIVGNKKISDEAILEQVRLCPGQLLSYPDLRAAEKNLSRLKGFKSNPKVTVIDHVDEFKDIRITVEEK